MFYVEHNTKSLVRQGPTVTEVENLGKMYRLLIHVCTMYVCMKYKMYV